MIFVFISYQKAYLNCQKTAAVYVIRISLGLYVLLSIQSSSSDEGNNISLKENTEQLFLHDKMAAIFAEDFFKCIVVQGTSVVLFKIH